MGGWGAARRSVRARSGALIPVSASRPRRLRRTMSHRSLKPSRVDRPINAILAETLQWVHEAAIGNIAKTRGEASSRCKFIIYTRAESDATLELTKLYRRDYRSSFMRHTDWSRSLRFLHVAFYLDLTVDSGVSVNPTESRANGRRLSVLHRDWPSRICSPRQARRLLAR